MKKKTSKKALYWLLGETAGRTSVGVWKWLWGMPVESGGKVSAQIAKESLISMQEYVKELADGVAFVAATSEKAQQQYNKKKSEFYEAEKNAQLAYEKGNIDAARLAMTKAIAIEKVLPKLKLRVDKAVETTKQAKEKLRRESEKLEAYKFDLANMESLAEMNQAMAKIGQFSSEFDLGTAKEQFENAKESIETKALIEEAKEELNTNSLEELQAATDLLSLDAEIEQRLQNLSLPSNTKRYS